MPNFTTTLLLSSTLFLFSHAASLFHPNPQPIHFQGALLGEDEYEVISWEVKKFTHEKTSSKSEGNSSSVVLAAHRTHRKDPLNKFRHYKGGWNITEKHYFSSVGFTAAPLFVISAIWFLGFGFSLLFVALYHSCCHRIHYGYSKTAYTVSLAIVIFFTITAFIGCIVLYTGQGKFHNSTKSAMDYVLDQAGITINNLRNVAQSLDAAKRVGVDEFSLTFDAQNNIDKMLEKINNSTSILEYHTENSSENIQNVLDSVRVTLIIVAAAMLVLAFMGFLLSILGLQFFVNILTMVGWVLVTSTFILCGVFLIIHNMVDDTCFAMVEWVQQPTTHTALENVLPCANNATAQKTLLESKDVTYQLAGVIDNFIANMSNTDNIIIDGHQYYNQSGPLLPSFCNPYNSNKSNRICAAGEVNFGNAAQEWRKYVCQVSPTGTCVTVGRLTPNLYDQITEAVNVSYSLSNYAPFLVGLEDCSLVRKTASEISQNHCPGLSLYSKWVYIGLAMVSVAVMFLLLSWALYTREKRHRSYVKRLTEASAENPLAGKGP